jgi:hypothetical protein
VAISNKNDILFSFCSLFNDVVSISVYMIRWWWIMNLDGFGRKRPWHNFRLYPGICLWELTKTRKPSAVIVTVPNKSSGSWLSKKENDFRDILLLYNRKKGSHVIYYPEHEISRSIKQYFFLRCFAWLCYRKLTSRDACRPKYGLLFLRSTYWEKLTVLDKSFSLLVVEKKRLQPVYLIDI